MQRFIYLVLITLVIPFMTQAQETSPYIVIDQFGYLPESEKVAVIRDPEEGFDAEETYTPGEEYALIDASSDEAVYTGTIAAWKDGAVDSTSGDRVWWFDFSEVTTSGEYYILDQAENVRSFTFSIGEEVYHEVLKQAVRTYFYQRAGMAKEEPYAASAWTDDASHIGPLQDKNARLFSAPDDADTERDLHGGWYDAGDYNQYTSWTANVSMELMMAYQENPGAWTDDYNIPESGNDIPDILDEVKYGMDWLIRMQNDDGGVLCVLGRDHASPPSDADGQSLYGPASTSATLTAAAAYAKAAKIYKAYPHFDEFVADLEDRAVAAWQWADENPEVIFRNNDADYDSEGLAAGQQEVDDYGRFVKKMAAAIFLFDLTGGTEYQSFIDDNYQDVNMMEWGFVFPFQMFNQDVLLHYASLEDATPAVANDIKDTYAGSVTSFDGNFPAVQQEIDPYRAHIENYTWGSNRTKANQGLIYYQMVMNGMEENDHEAYLDAAEEYIHYIHGVNPLQWVYLSNMSEYGAEKSINTFYHTWFYEDNPLWSHAEESEYGPAPGFLTGGANPGYNWNECCPDNCGSTGNNERCFSENIEPPKGQPEQKSYKDFNTGWPLDSWSVTENSTGYQAAYVRLLSKFVTIDADCEGTRGGSAVIDSCGVCAGGNTGIEPNTTGEGCVTSVNKEEKKEEIKLYPNPATEQLTIALGEHYQSFTIKVRDVTGSEIGMYEGRGTEKVIPVSSLAAGTYMLVVRTDKHTTTLRFHKQ